MRTIEGELFPALIKAGAIPPDREIDTVSDLVLPVITIKPLIEAPLYI